MPAGLEEDVPMRVKLFQGRGDGRGMLVYPATAAQYRESFRTRGRPASRCDWGAGSHPMDSGLPSGHRHPLRAQAALRSKDGTSAGLAMVAALVSLFTGRPVRRGLAMTGEITLSGHVVPVGGVRQKVLAPQRRGLITVVLPRGNEEQLDARFGGDDVRRGVTVHSVCRINEFLELVLRPAEAACCLAVESTAPLRAALAAGVPE